MDLVLSQEQRSKPVQHCSGSGQINVEQNTAFGRMVNRRACNVL